MTAAPQAQDLASDPAPDLASDPASDLVAGTVHVLGRGPYEVVGTGAPARVRSVEAAVGHALAALNLRATSLTPLLACHAAVIARAGAALVVPAASGRGKSTLTAALLRHGWAYGSDEALGLTWDSGAVVPYPRPFSLSRWSAEVTGTTGGVQGPEETYHLPGRLLAAGTGVGHVVLLERGSGRADLRPVHRSEALVELLRRSFTHHRDAGRALALYADLLRATACWRLHLGDPMDAARLLTHRLDGARGAVS